MNIFNDSSFFYIQVIDLMELNDYKSALITIINNIPTLKNKDDIALAYLICGFINTKLEDYSSAINDFSKSINFESKLEILNLRSKDISFCARSESKYQTKNYKGSIEDKREAKKIRLKEIDSSPDSNEIIIDYKNILLGTFLDIELEPKFKALIKASKIKNRKYDLIEDYKKVISKKRRDEVVKKLERLSQSKYQIGDFKASIRALRRADKYF